MDRFDEVEVFRSILIQKGVVAPDGSETVLAGLLCSDKGAVSHFCDSYLSEPVSSEERYIRMAYSTLERNQMLCRDLMILTLWGQYLESNRLAHGFESASERVQNLGFKAFRRLDYQEMREMVSSVRSKATATFCDLREKSQAQVPALLRKNCTKVQ